MSIKPSVVYIKGVHSITGHDTDSDIGFPQLELEKLFEGAIIKETTDTAYDSNKKYIHYDSLNNQVVIQDTDHFNCIKNGYYSVANGINHYYTKSGDNYNYNTVPSNINTWAGKWSFSNTIKNKDLYSIDQELERICVGNNTYYKKSGNNYVKQDVLTYNTYTGSIHVNWSNEYKGETILNEETFEDIKVWKTKSGIIATSGYYLSVDTKPNNTYIVKLLKLTFDGAGTITNGAATGTLYKLPSDFNFQDSAFYYVKNSNNFEGLKVNQGQCTFTTNPTTDNNFYIYQKGADWPYPNTTGPQYSVLARNNVYADVYSASSFPLYTEMEAMTAYVGDKAKLSFSGTKATLALPGLYWTKANMDMAFYKCSSFNQKMIIQNSVTSMVSTFEGCSSFNQPDMLIYSQNITNMTNAFKGCHINNVHIPASVPKSTSNFMYNCLVNGNTGITFPAANIFNDLN